MGNKPEWLQQAEDYHRFFFEDKPYKEAGQTSPEVRQFIDDVEKVINSFNQAGQGFNAMANYNSVHGTWQISNAPTPAVVVAKPKPPFPNDVEIDGQNYVFIGAHHLMAPSPLRVQYDIVYYRGNQQMLIIQTVGLNNPINTDFTERLDIEYERGTVHVTPLGQGKIRFDYTQTQPGIGFGVAGQRYYLGECDTDAIDSPALDLRQTPLNLGNFIKVNRPDGTAGVDGAMLLARAATMFRDDVAAYRSLGLVKATKHPNLPLVLFHYLDEASYTQTWGVIERAARGLVVDYETGKIISRPWEKFFNLNEMPETKQENLPANMGFQITDKLDGSLIIVSVYGGALLVHTKGDFNSPQAGWAYNFIQKNYPKLVKNASPYQTYLFEAIYPENRNVIKYGGLEALPLLDVIHKDSGKSVGRKNCETVSKNFEIPLVDALTVAGDIKELVKYVENQTGIEGYVLRYDNGLMVKVKTEEYRRLHRLYWNFHPNRVIEAYKLGGYEQVEAYVTDLPDETQRQKALEWGRQLDGYIQNIYAQAGAYFMLYYDGNQKEFARTLAREVPKHLVDYVFRYQKTEGDFNQVRELALKRLNPQEVLKGAYDE